MRCISPILVRSNGRRDFVPCGKCNHCLQTKRFDWSFRLLQESKKAVTAHFLTMTYDEINVPGDSSLCKRDVQLFTKRLRKENASFVSTPVRYYTVGEYGTKSGRPHYHSIIFNLHASVVSRLSDFWKLGNCYVGDVEIASIHYVTKYVINRHGDCGGREPPFSLMSRRPGIGSRYLDTHRGWHRSDMRNYTQVNGEIARLPRYYKDKFFSDVERANMALDSIAQADLDYEVAVSRLAKFHDDPYYYYDYRIQRQHDAIVSKVNFSNKF